MKTNESLINREVRSMASMISILKSKREVLIDRWMDNDPKEKTKLLVSLIDIEDDIDQALKQQKRSVIKRFN